jgi:hypothetical protein
MAGCSVMSNTSATCHGDTISVPTTGLLMAPTTVVG